MINPLTVNYRNPKFSWDNYIIDCEIDHPVYGWIPFSCNPKDTGSNFDVNVLYQRILQENEVPKTSQSEIDQRYSLLNKMKRHEILKNIVDPIITNPLRWAELTPEKQQEWANYRKNLLDLSEQKGWPQNIDWPTPPST